MIKMAALLTLSMLLTGCVSLTLGTKHEPDRVQVDGLADGYVVVDAVRPFDGRIIELGLLGAKDTWGNLASVEVWPIGGVGLSFIGAKARLAFLEAGVGALGYHPRPSWNRKPKDDAGEEMAMEEEDDDHDDEDFDGAF